MWYAASAARGGCWVDYATVYYWYQSVPGGFRHQPLRPVAEQELLWERIVYPTFFYRGGIMTRIGFATGYDPSLTILDMAGWIQKAEERGYEIGFFS